MKKRVITATAVALIIMAAVFGFRLYAIRQVLAELDAKTPAAVTVSIAESHEAEWPNTLHSLGSLASVQGIMLKTELGGKIARVAAISGGAVRAGDLLIELDTSTEAAQLAGLEAQAKLAESGLLRARELRAHGTNTPNDLDNAEAMLSQAQAAVNQVRTVIEKKRIAAPFDGRLGVVNLNVGQYLNAGDALGALENISQIHADFSLPQKELGQLTGNETVRLRVDTYAGLSFEGRISAISPRLDEATRSLEIRATFENKEQRLRPGMYAKVEVILPPTGKAIVIPWAAVVYNPYGETVYVVEQDRVQQRFIKTGRPQGDLIVVREGLRLGEQVVTSGQIKLRNGSRVKIDNAVAPDSNPAPVLKES